MIVGPIGKFVNSLNSAKDFYLARKSIANAMKLSLDLRQLINEPSTPKFLDLGCGFGSASILATRDGLEVYALHIDKRQLLWERNLKSNLGISLVVADGQALTFQDSTFDVVYCCHALEHVPDDSNVLIEIHRVLKRDGIFLLSTPNKFNLSSKFRRKLKRQSTFISREHLREYDRDQISERLQKFGFYILDLNMTGFLLPLGNTIFNFIVMQFGLQKIKNYLAKRFPKSSESIDIVATKKENRHKEELRLQRWEQIFPLPWWLRK